MEMRRANNFTFVEFVLLQEAYPLLCFGLFVELPPNPDSG